MIFMIISLQILLMNVAHADGVSVTQMTDLDKWSMLGGIVVSGLSALCKQAWMTPVMRVAVVIAWSVISAVVTDVLEGSLNWTDWFGTFMIVILTSVAAYHTLLSAVLGQLEQATNVGRTTAPANSGAGR
jgi:hypothetical protein